MSLGKTKLERINTVYGGGGHVVILGAGASIASTIRNPEKKGKKLPSMDNFIEVVGLTDLVKQIPENLIANNFETLYSNLYASNDSSKIIKSIESTVFEYFRDMELPNEPTIYDYLLMSLRPRDLIATFNWDPFLYQAYIRNSEIADLPNIVFLHGNVAIGYCKEENVTGPAGWFSKKSGGYFKPTKLLYPIAQKNYNADEFLLREWKIIKAYLHAKSTHQVTIFGYGAPATDLEAIKLLNEAWGTGDDRAMEQFEIIDIRQKEEVRLQWDNFINTHHYDYTSNYFQSSLAYNPRRTFEWYHQHMLPMTFSDSFSASNPIPNDFKTLKEFWDWHQPLIDAEEKWKSQS